VTLRDHATEFRSDYGRATDAFTLRDQVLKQLLEAGTYRALIDRCCPLEQAVDATRYAETKQTTGKAVLAVRGGRGP